jgi:hypothetical protein
MGIPRGVAGPAAESGKAVHAAIQAVLSGGKMPEKLTAREQFVANYMVRAVVEEESKIEGKPVAVFHEHPVTIRATNNEVIWHGFLDRVAVWKHAAIFWEWKTGRGRVSHAVENVQARLYVAGTYLPLIEAKLLDAESSVSVCMVSAGEDFGEWLTKADFSPSSVRMAEMEAQTIWMTADAPNAPRAVGRNQCRFCPANGTIRCPESTTQMAMMRKDYTDEVLANPRACGALYALWKQIEPMGKKVGGALRELLEKGVDGTGYTLGKPGKTPEVGDPNAVFSAMQGKLNAEQFISAVSVSVPALADALYEASKTADTGKLTKDQARKMVDGILTEAGLLTFKPKAAPILEVEKDGA